MDIRRAGRWVWAWAIGNLLWNGVMAAWAIGGSAVITALVGSILATATAMPTPFLILLSGGVFLLSLAGMGEVGQRLGIGRNETRVSGGETVEPTPVESPRIYLKVTPEYLMGIPRDQMAIQASKSIEHFIGKWLKVSGTVTNVSSSDSDTIVTFANPNFTLIQMYFEKGWHGLVSALNREQQITVIGQVQQVQAYALILTKCEVLEY